MKRLYIEKWSVIGLISFLIGLLLTWQLNTSGGPRGRGLGVRPSLGLALG